MQYRKGVEKLTNAVTVWNQKRNELSFVLNLGDIIDGNDTEVMNSPLFNEVLSTGDHSQRFQFSHGTIQTTCEKSN